MLSILSGGKRVIQINCGLYNTFSQPVLHRCLASNAFPKIQVGNRAEARKALSKTIRDTETLRASRPGRSLGTYTSFREVTGCSPR
jgi:hypothetical protein